MTRDEFLGKMLEKGKVTQAQIDKVKAKDTALENYKSKGALMTKTEMQAVLDIVCGKSEKSQKAT